MHQTKKLTLTVFLTIPLNKLHFSKSSPKNLLPSIVESQTENYRELLPHLLLGVKIKEPLELQNLTVGQRLLSMDWSNLKVSKSVEDVFHLEKHNSLCLAHGHKPIA